MAKRWCVPKMPSFSMPCGQWHKRSCIVQPCSRIKKLFSQWQFCPSDRHWDSATHKGLVKNPGKHLVDVCSPNRHHGTHHPWTNSLKKKIINIKDGLQESLSFCNSFSVSLAELCTQNGISLSLSSKNNSSCYNYLPISVYFQPQRGHPQQ